MNKGQRIFVQATGLFLAFLFAAYVAITMSTHEDAEFWDGGSGYVAPKAEFQAEIPDYCSKKKTQEFHNVIAVIPAHYVGGTEITTYNAALALNTDDNEANDVHVVGFC